MKTLAGHSNWDGLDCVDLAQVELCFPESLSLCDSKAEPAEREVSVRLGE